MEIVKRKKLKGIAYGIANTFCSRNNDIGGYWAIGILYKAAIKHNSHSFSIDLVNHRCEYSGDGFNAMVKAYCNYMDYLAVRSGLAVSNIESANIDLVFDPSQSKRIVHLGAPEGTALDPYSCEMTIRDDLGVSRSGYCDGLCFPHNPSLSIVLKSSGIGRWHYSLEDSERETP